MDELQSEKGGCKTMSTCLTLFVHRICLNRTMEEIKRFYACYIKYMYMYMHSGCSGNRVNDRFASYKCNSQWLLQQMSYFSKSCIQLFYDTFTTFRTNIFLGYPLIPFIRNPSWYNTVKMISTHIYVKTS